MFTILFWMILRSLSWNIQCQSQVREPFSIISFSNDLILNAEHIRPICLPLFEPLKSKEFTKEMPYVAGWGATIYQGPQSNTLRDAQVPIIPLETCAKNYQKYFPHQLFDKRVVCAGYGGRDTCQGDSGGPLMLQQVKWKQFCLRRSLFIMNFIIK